MKAQKNGGGKKPITTSSHEKKVGDYYLKNISRVKYLFISSQILYS